MKIWRAEVVQQGKAGEVLSCTSDGLLVACGENALNITELEEEDGGWLVGGGGGNSFSLLAGCLCAQVGYEDALVFYATAQFTGISVKKRPYALHGYFWCTLLGRYLTDTGIAPHSIAAPGGIENNGFNETCPLRLS